MEAAKTQCVFPFLNRIDHCYCNPFLCKCNHSPTKNIVPISHMTFTPKLQHHTHCPLSMPTFPWTLDKILCSYMTGITHAQVAARFGGVQHGAVQHHALTNPLPCSHMTRYTNMHTCLVFRHKCGSCVPIPFWWCPTPLPSQNPLSCTHMTRYTNMHTCLVFRHKCGPCVAIRVHLFGILLLSPHSHAVLHRKFVNVNDLILRPV